MLERVLKGTPKFYLWLSFLLCIIGYAFIVYVFQLCYGLKITGLSRNISWGFYIAQFTYLWVWRRAPSCWCCLPTSIITSHSSG